MRSGYRCLCEFGKDLSGVVEDGILSKCDGINLRWKSEK